MSGLEQTQTNGGIDDDTVFDMLSNQRRRLTLRMLREDEPLTLGELAERIASYEEDVPRGHLTAEDRKRVYIALYQSHFQKMVNADLIRKVGEEEFVLGENADDVLWYLDHGPRASVKDRFFDLLS